MSNEIKDYGGRVLAVGDRVVIASVRRVGRFALPSLKEATVTKVKTKTIDITGRASALDPVKCVKVGP